MEMKKSVQHTKFQSDFKKEFPFATYKLSPEEI